LGEEYRGQTSQPSITDSMMSRMIRSGDFNWA